MTRLAVKMATEQGQFDAAEQMLKSTLASHTQQLGADHPEVATDLENLGEFYSERGDFPKAKEALEQALAKRKDVLGPNHPETGRCLLRFARIYVAHEQFADAEPLLLQAIAIGRLAESDKDLLTSALYGLQQYYSEQEKFPEAQAVCEEMLNAVQQSLGPFHPDVATAMNNLGLMLKKQGKYAEARPLYEDSLARGERVFPGSELVATRQNNLAELLANMDLHDEAQVYFIKAAETLKRRNGPDSETAWAIAKVGNGYVDVGDVDNAVRYLDEAAAMYTQLAGADSEPVAELHGKKAMLYLQHKRFEQALKEQDAHLAFCRGVVQAPGSPPEAANLLVQSLNKRATILRAMNKDTEAEAVLREALATCQRLLGPDHATTTMQMNNLAGLLLDNGRLDEAESTFKVALDVLKRNPSAAANLIVLTLNNLAGVCMRRKQPDAARTCLQEALEHIRRAPADNYEYAMAMNNLAGNLYTTGSVGEGRALGVEALGMTERVKGADDPLSLTLRFMWGEGGSLMNEGPSENMQMAIIAGQGPQKKLQWEQHDEPADDAQPASSEAAAVDVPP